MYSPAVITVNANPLALGGLALETLAWAGVAGSCGTSINYSQSDFKDYTDFDMYGNLRFTDLSGAQCKVNNDYKILGEQTKNSFLDCLNSAENERALAETQYKNGEITLQEYTALDAHAGSLRTTADNIAKWIGTNSACVSVKQLTQLELGSQQLKLFSEYLKANGSSISKGKITVNNGVKGTFTELSKINIPADMVMYYTPVCSRNISYCLQYGPKVYDLQAINLVTGQINTVTGIRYTKCSFLQANYYHLAKDGRSLDILYYQVVNGKTIGDGEYNGGYSAFDLGTSMLDDAFRLSLSNCTEGILSASLPTVVGGTATVPQTSVPTKTIPTTFPLDTDVPVVIPVPDTDAILNSIASTAVPTDIPVDIPDVGELPKDLPDLSISASITNRFPFCLPFDLARAVKLLVAEPVTPKWHVPIKIPLAKVLGGGYWDMSFDIDFKDFETLSVFSRWFFTLIFTFGLIFVTSKIVKGAGS